MASMQKKVFYSWQSDTKVNLLINKCLIQAIEKLNTEGVFFQLESDGRDGSSFSDINTDILNHIDSAFVFIGDVTIINPDSSDRKTPNPNVMFELGYALNVLSESKIFCVCNIEFGKIDELPFDIRNRKIIPFKGSDSKANEKLTKILFQSLKLAHDLPHSSTKERNNPDYLTFNKIKTILPPNGSIKYLRDKLITNKFSWDKLRDFEHLEYEAHYNPELVFINTELENLKNDLIIKWDVFWKFLSNNSFPTEDEDQIFYIPQDWKKTIPKQYYSVLEEVEKNRNALLEICDKFYKRSKQIIQY